MMNLTDKIYSGNSDRNEAISVIGIIVFGIPFITNFVLIAGILETDSQLFSFLAYGTIPATLIALVYIALKDPHRSSEKDSRSVVPPAEERLSELHKRYAHDEINEEQLEEETEKLLEEWSNENRMSNRE